MLTSIYIVTNEKGLPVARMYGYHALKNLVKVDKTFTAKNVKLKRSKCFKIGNFELTELTTTVKLIELTFEV